MINDFESKKENKIIVKKGELSVPRAKVSFLGDSPSHFTASTHHPPLHAPPPSLCHKSKILYKKRRGRRKSKSGDPKWRWVGGGGGGTHKYRLALRGGPPPTTYPQDSKRTPRYIVLSRRRGHFCLEEETVKKTREIVLVLTMVIISRIYCVSDAG